MRPTLLPYALIAALALCAPGVAAAAASPAATAAPAPSPQLVRKVDIPYESFTLANGLRVIVHEDRKAPVVAVSVWYGVGSSDEPRRQDRLRPSVRASDVQRLGEYAGEFFEPLEDVGATDSNGTTNGSTAPIISRPCPTAGARHGAVPREPTGWAICSGRSPRSSSIISAASSRTRSGRATTSLTAWSDYGIFTGAVSRRPSLPPFDDRLDGRPRRRERSADVQQWFRDPLRPEQCGPGPRRRHRRGPGPSARREIFRRRSRAVRRRPSRPEPSPTEARRLARR